MAPLISEIEIAEKKVQSNSQAEELRKSYKQDLKDIMTSYQNQMSEMDLKYKKISELQVVELNAMSKSLQS